MPSLAPASRSEGGLSRAAGAVRLLRIALHTCHRGAGSGWRSTWMLCSPRRWRPEPIGPSTASVWASRTRALQESRTWPLQHREQAQRYRPAFRAAETRKGNHGYSDLEGRSIARPSIGTRWSSTDWINASNMRGSSDARPAVHRHRGPMQRAFATLCNSRWRACPTTSPSTRWQGDHRRRPGAFHHRARSPQGSSQSLGLLPRTGPR